MTMDKILSPKAHKTRQERFFILFSTVVLMLNTIGLSTQIVSGEEMWIVHAKFPGSQGAYSEQFASVWCQTMGTAAYFALICLISGFLIYRCFVMWSDVRAVILPGILWIAALALGLIKLWASGAPHGKFAGLAANVVVAYGAMTIAISVLGTSLLVGRILYFARQSKLLGVETQNMQMYYGATAIVAESMLPTALANLAVVVSLGMNSEVSIVFDTISGGLGCVGPQLLILRVVQGRAWRRNQLSDAMTSIAFASRAPPRASLYMDSTASRGEDGDIRVDLERRSDLSADDAGSSTIS
ncbi:hypothetical protein BV25DRAFT_1829645 [Artomyces pyxidatus]|uniref:Uncharacterized protein n=1 Tax=Artomyces pyxidatus TaxID=48021 RepID=A0ACB8SRN8_9AGAM|nr:hypothetical protein BV25DRAFT_1829645 [Artomyces pyxidatus]